MSVDQVNNQEDNNNNNSNRDDVEVIVIDSDGEEENNWKDDDFLSFDVTGDKTKDGDEEQDDDDDDNEEGDYNSMASSDMDESDSDTNNDRSKTQDRLPPWIDRISNNRRLYDPHIIHPLTALHNEIVSFCSLMEPLPSDARQRGHLVHRIRMTVKKHFDKDTQVHVFGSQATGLMLPTSDIDLVVVTKEDKDGVGDDNKKDDKNQKEEDYDHREHIQPIHRFADAIKSDWLDEISYFEVIENTRVPLVKFTHAPTNIQVDVCFNQMSGPPAAQLMKRYLEALPPLRPLTFVLKYFLAARSLNEPYSGGVGSYMLQLLIVAFLQHRERDAYNFQRPTVYNLGSLLLEFFELYGMNFNYTTTGISLRNDGYFFPKGAPDRKETFYNPTRPFMMALENPLDITHDVGTSSFRFQTVQRAFAVAYKTLLSYTAAPILVQVPSILATILPPTDYMTSRMVLKRRDRALSTPRGRNESPNNRSRKRQRRN